MAVGDLRVQGWQSGKRGANGAIPLGWIGAVLAGSLLAVVLLMYTAGLTIDPLAPGTLVFAAAFAMLGAIRWHCRHPQARIVAMVRDGSEWIGLFIAVSLIGAVASYPIASFTHGFVDADLYRVDEALHFHWLEWYYVVADHRWLQVASRTAYSMIYVSPAILLVYYAMIGARRQALDFIAAVWLAALMTLVAFRFIPAVGPFAYLLWSKPVAYLPISELWQPALIPHLRAHTLSHVDLAHLVGLVSAPSFHAAAATLLIVFAARQPPIRVPLVAVNLAMLLATPVEGTHYLTDMILGAAVAFLSLAIIALGRAVALPVENNQALSDRRLEPGPIA